jgi:hypothetical protein
MWKANGSVLSYTNRSAATVSAATISAATISAATTFVASTQHAVACICKLAVSQCAESVRGAISMTRAYMQRLVCPL